MKIEIEPNDMAEFVGQIIDIFEDFLDEKGVIIPNEDRDMEEDAEYCANIYGMDYGNLQEDIENTLQRWSNNA